MKIDDILSAIAHYEMMAGAEKAVMEIKGVLDFYKRAMSPEQVRLMRRYEKIKLKACQDLAALMEKNGWGNGGGK